MFWVEIFSKSLVLPFEIVSSLEIQPEASGQAEIVREAERDVGADGARPLDDFVDPPHRNTDVFRQVPNADASGREKIF
jgi:hypothetical protein